MAIGRHLAQVVGSLLSFTLTKTENRKQHTMTDTLLVSSGVISANIEFIVEEREYNFLLQFAEQTPEGLMFVNIRNMMKAGPPADYLHAVKIMAGIMNERTMAAEVSNYSLGILLQGHVADTMYKATFDVILRPPSE